MSAEYLRVKNWREFQHYDPLKRRPPWIKFHNTVLDPGTDFQYLSEMEQWQLVRLWLIASRSDLITLDEDGKVVQVIPNDEAILRRSAMTLKRIPLAKFVQAGWLIPVPASNVASVSASTGASALVNAGASARGAEEPEEPKSEDEPKSGSSSALATVSRLPAATGQGLVAFFVERSRSLGSDPPSRVKGQVARLCGELLSEGVQPDRVRAGLELLLEKRLHPSTLPSLVHEASLPRRNGTRVTPSDILAAAEEARLREQEAFHDAT